MIHSLLQRLSHDESLPLHAPPPPVSGVVPTPMVSQKPKTRPSSRMDKKQHRGKKLLIKLYFSGSDFDEIKFLGLDIDGIVIFRLRF